MKKKEKKEKITHFRQNLLESIRPFPESIQYFVLGAMSILWEAPEKWDVSTRGETLAKTLNL